MKTFFVLALLVVWTVFNSWWSYKNTLLIREHVQIMRRINAVNSKQLQIDDQLTDRILALESKQKGFHLWIDAQMDRRRELVQQVRRQK